MSKKWIIIVGGFHEIIELCEDLKYSIIGIIDNVLPSNSFSYPILGTDKDIDSLFKEFGTVPLVLTPDSPIVRKKLYHLYSDIGFSFETVISPYARISNSAKIGQGAIVQHGVNVSSNTNIGRFVKLNINSNVMHDSYIGDYSTIAPNAVILGRIKIGEGSYIGANATILPNKNIEKNVMIGAGAVVTKSINKENSIYVGNPAKEITK